MTTNIFELAARNKVRFQSAVGQLTTEQLWDLPVPNLKKIAIAYKNAIKGLDDDEFEDDAPSKKERDAYELQLEILKFVIADKKAVADAAKARADKALQVKVLREALANKQNDKINSMSEEDLIKQIELLSAA